MRRRRKRKKASSELLFATTAVWVAVVCSVLLVVSSRGRAPVDFSRKQKFWFPVQMCDDEGRCGERPDEATARTRYSLRSAQQEGLWYRKHEHNARKAARFRCDGAVLLGDSIFESFQGTSYGQPVERADGVPEVLEKYYPSSLNLAISGDQTQHLLWRLPRELPECALNTNVSFVVLIGTNNLGAGFLPEDTARGVAAVVDWLLSNTQGRVFLLALLPRGDSPKTICPPRCRKDGSPFRSFAPAVDQVNAALERHYFSNNNDDASSSSLAMYNRGRVRFVSARRCGDVIFLRGDSNNNNTSKHRGGVRLDRMPDALHPNAEGHALFAHCLLPELRSRETSSS
mmetsp:Transcript_7436/g.24524  ORF Transcript_7436/g.24524 Transcript_7436/m.24524 type:complete len:343 (+) Transcript_7436:4046-5074(+)